MPALARMLRAVRLIDRRFFSAAAEVLPTSSVLCEVDSVGVAVLTLNRPRTLNAMTIDMGIAFEQHIASLRNNPAVRAVVLTGSGSGFSAGGDLQFLLARSADTPFNNAVEMRAFYKRFMSLRSLPVPIIAAINGPAIGAGLCVAAACDMRVVAAKAKLGMSSERT